jgi:membrane-associated HD superfamily phosphohydrolase
MTRQQVRKFELSQIVFLLLGAYNLLSLSGGISDFLFITILFQTIWLFFFAFRTDKRLNNSRNVNKIRLLLFSFLTLLFVIIIITILLGEVNDWLRLYFGAVYGYHIIIGLFFGAIIISWTILNKYILSLIVKEQTGNKRIKIFLKNQFYLVSCLTLLRDDG